MISCDECIVKLLWSFYIIAVALSFFSFLGVTYQMLGLITDGFNIHIKNQLELALSISLFLVVVLGIFIMAIDDRLKANIEYHKKLQQAQSTL